MLGRLKKRSTETEIMDDFKRGGTQLKEVLDDINRVNRILGGNAITIEAFAKLVREHPQERYIVLDVGCGDGTMLREVAQYCRKREINADFIGIDLNTNTLQIAQEASVGYPEIRFLKQDVLELNQTDLNCDILITTLTTHHFSNEQLPALLKQCARLAKIGVINNDLHRSRVAFYLFKIFSLIFIKTNTAKIDGLISIRKGFKKHDLLNFAKDLPHMRHIIEWKWAFRYVWIMQPKRPNTP
ncbi:methyltransferase domain-containing protein [Aggregatimonas sangjinii]|uniref:Methyltransferase domain-containing protein n=1 Tax=Aggregatimonas sangjinii TaxID=2583587 RepID=A0A5B7SP72_9FLAO|nr:methyltransferase domain-containing protein [Aggregatimonas sangjinii]QCW99971.1 methyltransferase domain-containing protein [Aggregatimonas sangjinii]